RHKKQSGGSGQFGEVYLRVEPVAETTEGLVDGLDFVDDTFGGSVPKQYLPAIEKGVRRVMLEGAIAGYPMQNIRVSVYDGKHHAVDSKEIAFMTAGRRAFVDAVQKASPVLLEPFVKLEITVPMGYIGDISSDLSGRRGRIQGTDMLPGELAIVSAEAPLSEVMSYANQLKSITGGAGSYVMEYSHDENTPPNVQASVVASFNPQSEED
ncbi:MAG: elongation factor G, partial [Phycisphaerae bacterium]|nr:elongation factor G [Phycisphaerae bacterium]